MGMSLRSTLRLALLLAAAASQLALVAAVAFYAPEAQAQAGGVAQKIFYFHVPAAYAMYLSGLVCLVGSAAYLVRPTTKRDAWASAGAESAVLFGVIVLVSGPLWAKKAWGVYWTWDPRLTTLLLSALIYLAVVTLRSVAGEGDGSRRFAAALGVLGTATLPIVHLSVRKWGGNHPAVLTHGGGGIAPAMGQVLVLGFVAMTFLAVLVIECRAQLAWLRWRVEELEERAEIRDAPPED